LLIVIADLLYYSALEVCPLDAKENLVYCIDYLKINVGKWVIKALIAASIFYGLTL
jgi:hypothetical protein